MAQSNQTKTDQICSQWFSNGLVMKINSFKITDPKQFEMHYRNGTKGPIKYYASSLLYQLDKLKAQSNLVNNIHWFYLTLVLMNPCTDDHLNHCCPNHRVHHLSS